MQTRRRIVGLRLAVLTAALAMTLTGCGQKGPLTLPASADTSAQPTPPHVQR